MPEVTVTAEMSEGPAPAAVELQVTQGERVLRAAQVDPEKPAATFEVDEGDYVARARSLVPHGTPAESSFAVPIRVTVR